MPLQPKQLLWVDDDGSGRFLFEELMLTRAGCTVRWATDAQEAAHALAGSAFDALLLDQQLPFDHRSERDLKAARPWGGCLLLYWLRGRQPPRYVPAVSDFFRLYEVQPLAHNRSLPVRVISAYQDAEIVEAMRAASPLDAGLRFLNKPIAVEEILRLLPYDDTHC